MKYWFFLLMITSIARPVFSQDTKKNIIKINALGLVFGLGSFIYERQLSESFTVSLTPSVGVYNTTIDVDYRTYGIGGEFRYYFLEKPAPFGLHIGIGGNTLFGNAVYDSPSFYYKSKITGFNAYSNLGFQYILKNGISIDAGGGVQYVRFNLDNSGSISLGILPNAVLSVGYAF